MATNAFGGLNTTQSSNPFGGGGMASGSWSSSAGAPQMMSPTADPTFMELYKRISGGMIPTQMNSLQSMVQGGMNSPLLSAILEPAMQQLMVKAADSRTALADQARMAGASRSGAYQNAISRNEGNIMNAQGNLISDVISRMLSPLIQGQLQEQRNQFLPAESYMNLLGLIKPSMFQPRTASGSGSSSSGWENIPPSLGLGTPMYGDIMGPAGGIPRPSQTVPTLGAPPPAVATPPSPPQYYPPYTGGGGGLGGGSYDLGLGAGTQYLYSPATPGTGWWGEYGASNADFGGAPYIHEVLTGEW